MTIRLRQGIMGKEEDIRLDQKVRAAWMYYIAGLNQSEIASQLGTSRPVVQRMIAAAKEEGIVSIGLHHPVANCLDYAQLLQEKYRLVDCNIVPAWSEESTLDSVSFGCYQLMARYLQDDKAKIIGIGSGLSTIAVGARLRQLLFPVAQERRITGDAPAKGGAGQVLDMTHEEAFLIVLRRDEAPHGTLLGINRTRHCSPARPAGRP